MKAGIQYVNGISVKEAGVHGFNDIEVRFEDIENASGILDEGFSISGICVSLKAMTDFADGKDILRENAPSVFIKALEYAVKSGAEYIVIETECVKSASVLEQLTDECAAAISKAGIYIYIENGFSSFDNRFYHNDYSEGALLTALAERLDALCGCRLFGICINIGHANLLGTNVRDLVDECGGRLKLMHINDNDGLSDQHQMPYTFTTGRGSLSTDWYHIIGSLFRQKFNGRLVFDTKGNLSRTPKQLHGVMFKLMRAVIHEWEDSCFRTEEYLAQPGRQIILFGAGKMAQNYMEAWGLKYRPAFLVDNNSKIWGQELMGLSVKSPAEILEIPAEKRNVWICNQYYDAIGLQLDKMGVEYRCYWDHYYL